MRHDNLELAGREEASWAGEFAMPEVPVVFIRDSELMLLLLVGLLALLVVTKSVEFLGTQDVGRIFEMA